MFVGSYVKFPAMSSNDIVEALFPWGFVLSCAGKVQLHASRSMGVAQKVTCIFRKKLSPKPRQDNLVVEFLRRSTEVCPLFG